MKFAISIASIADNERRLAAKCKQLNEDLVGAGARVTAALRLSEEDQTTIATLRKELEKTWRQIGASHDKVPATIPSSEACLLISGSEEQCLGLQP